MLSEKIELLGKGLYKDIPGELTLTSIPTISELDYVGSEDFEATMLDKILPEAVQEKGINFRNLLEIDFAWLCRCLRILNYGPYHTTNAIFCNNCKKTHYGEYQVDLRAIECKTLPEGFTNELKIPKESFLDFNGDIVVKLLTIQETINAYKDTAFAGPDGEVNKELARICYMISSIKGNSKLTPVEVKMMIQNELSAADFIVLKDNVSTLTDYGLRAGGSTPCPKCGNKEAAFIALVDDRFFRPSVGNLRTWKNDRSTREDENTAGSETATV